jgi:hypothetical protein
VRGPLGALRAYKRRSHGLHETTLATPMTRLQIRIL